MERHHSNCSVLCNVDRFILDISQSATFCTPIYPFSLKEIGVHKFEIGIGDISP